MTYEKTMRTREEQIREMTHGQPDGLARAYADNWAKRYVLEAKERGAAQAYSQRLTDAVHDVLTHESAWSKLLSSVPLDAEGYVAHEIAAFNRDMQRLRAALTREGE